MSDIKLCALDDIDDHESSGFIADFGYKKVAVLAVRQGETVYVYENSCPHIGTPMDVIPGEFLSEDGSHIECGTHLAQFRIEDGLCVEGPCEGDKLTQIKAEVRDGAVYVQPPA